MIRIWIVRNLRIWIPSFFPDFYIRVVVLSNFLFFSNFQTNIWMVMMVVVNISMGTTVIVFAFLLFALLLLNYEMQSESKWLFLLRITITTTKFCHILIMEVYTDNIMKIIESKYYENKKSYKHLKKLLVYVCVSVFVFDIFLNSLLFFFSKHFFCNENFPHL